MVETTSVCEEKPRLSTKDRLCLIQTINALPPPQFDELVFALDPPKGVVASSTAAQGTRSKELLDWIEGSSGPGLTVVAEVLQVLIPKATKTAPQSVAFVISGKISPSTAVELQAFVKLLRKKTGDDSIDIAFFQEGSIKLILNGSPEGLAKLQEMFEAGELEQLDIFPVEAVAPVDTNTKEARKAQLIQVLRLRGQSLRAINILNLDIDLARASARNIDIARARASALASARNIDIARNIVHNIAGDLDIARNMARDINIDRDHASALALASALAHNITRAHGLARRIDYASASASAITRDLALALDLARDLALDLARDLALARALDLSGADLSGANLKYINLVGVDLTGTNLSYADVTRTNFRDSLGLTEADKQDLESRGAIFQDPSSSIISVLVQGSKSLTASPSPP